MNITFEVTGMEKLEDVGPTLKAVASVDMYANGEKIVDLYDCLIFEDDEGTGERWYSTPCGEQGDPVIYFSSELDKKFDEALGAYYESHKNDLKDGTKVYQYIREN